jgi:hypothetical protein
VFVLLGLPAQRILPLTIVIPQLHAALSYYHAGLELSSNDQTIKTSEPFSPTDIEIPVPASWAFGDPAIVEIATDSDETDWDPIQIVSRDMLETFEQSGTMAVCFFGTPARMRFSWDPTQDSRRIRILYDEILSDPQAIDSDISTIPDYFVPMVAARVALDCLADVLERAPEREASLAVRGERLLTRLREFEKLWDAKRLGPKKQGVTFRPAFNRNRTSILRRF